MVLYYGVSILSSIQVSIVLVLSLYCAIATQLLTSMKYLNRSIVMWALLTNYLVLFDLVCDEQLD